MPKNIDAYRKYSDIAPGKKELPVVSRALQRKLWDRVDSLKKIAIKVGATAIYNKLLTFGEGTTPYDVKEIETALFTHINKMRDEPPLFEIQNVENAKPLLSFLDND